MKALLALVLAFAITPAFAGSQSADYTACKANAKEAFGKDAVVRVKTIRGKTLQMWVTTDESGRFVAVCDRSSFAVSKK